MSSRGSAKAKENLSDLYIPVGTAAGSSREIRTNSASKASCGARLNSSSARQASRTASAARSAPTQPLPRRVLPQGRRACRDGSPPTRPLRRPRPGRGTRPRAPRAARAAPHARRRAPRARTRCSASRAGRSSSCDPRLLDLARLRRRAPARCASTTAAAVRRVELPGRGRRRAPASISASRRSRRRGSSSRSSRSSRPRGDARERSARRVVELRRARVDERANRLLREPPERDELAARADRLRERAEIVRDQHDHGVAGGSSRSFSSASAASSFIRCARCRR